MIEMFRDSKEPGGRDLFSCSVAQWMLFQQLGRDFGWTPLGTTYLVASDSKAFAQAAVHGYTAGETADPKIVETADARNWARALEDCRRSPEFGTTNAGTDSELGDLTDEFIEYAYGGAFSFVLAAED